jgi:hypothetical protein
VTATDQRTTVGWRNVWAVFETSAERRLGRPLLVVYLVLTLVGIAVVIASVVIVHL